LDARADGGGFLGGGQSGFNYQSGQWVLGIDGQVSATTIKDTTSVLLCSRVCLRIGERRGEVGLDFHAAARAGWAFDRWLVYGKLGGARTHVHFDVSATINSIAGSAFATAWTDKTFSGWMLG
jgi:outer membrane immunogenic protein